MFQLKNEQLPTPLERLIEEMGTGNGLRTSHLDSHMVYGPVRKEDMMLMMEAKELFNQNPMETYPFLTASFHKDLKLVMTDQRELYTRL